MIRRAQDQRWILLSQVDHALLAGQLAETWGREPLEPLSAELAAAISHHDDGWSDWERRPKVDPLEGRPIAFTEMDLAEARNIWRGSIAAAQRIGPLAAHSVAGHFSAILSWYGSWKSDPQRRPLALDFLAEQQRNMQAWSAAWLAADPPNHTPDDLARGLAYLQMFDALSLWLCTADRDQPQTFATPQGTDVSFAPISTARFTATPWPFRADRLDLAITGRAVPVRRYTSDIDLAQAPSEQMRLEFAFAPG